jgi:YD repeat-containing protein
VPLRAPRGTACQFTYDGAGNVIEDRSASDVRRFTYDAGQRITEIVRGATKVALTYGPVGRMKTEVGGPNERTVWHFGELVERRLRSDGVTQIERSIPGPLGTFVSLQRLTRRSVANEEQIYRHGDGRANRVSPARTVVVHTARVPGRHVGRQ